MGWLKVVCYLLGRLLLGEPFEGPVAQEQSCFLEQTVLILGNTMSSSAFTWLLSKISRQKRRWRIFIVCPQMPVFRCISISISITKGSSSSFLWTPQREKRKPNPEKKPTQMLVVTLKRVTRTKSCKHLIMCISGNKCIILFRNIFSRRKKAVTYSKKQSYWLSLFHWLQTTHQPAW